MAKQKQANGITWTRQALDCYKRNYKCDGCIIKRIMISECKMKESIAKILEEIGPPINEVLIFSKVTKKQAEIIRGIKEGNKTKETLAKYLNIPEEKVQGRLRTLYEAAEEIGCKFPNKRKKLESLIQFIEIKSKEVEDEYFM